MMGTRKDEKGRRFEFLISRIDEALEKGFYVEAMAITYALFEERTYRLLDRLDVQYRPRDKLYDCLGKLEKAIHDRTITVVTKRMTIDDFRDMLDSTLIASNLIADIQDWRRKRNDVIHDLAKTTIDYNSLESTSEDARNLFIKYSAIIMKIKKNIDETIN